MLLDQCFLMPGGCQEEKCALTFDTESVLRRKLLKGDSKSHNFIVRATLVVICSVCSRGESLNPSGPDAPGFMHDCSHTLSSSSGQKA